MVDGLQVAPRNVPYSEILRGDFLSNEYSCKEMSKFLCLLVQLPFVNFVLKSSLCLEQFNCHCSRLNVDEFIQHMLSSAWLKTTYFSFFSQALKSIILRDEINIINPLITPCLAISLAGNKGYSPFP